MQFGLSLEASRILLIILVSIFVPSGPIISRWQLEVTFEEVRANLGVETQRSVV